MSDVLTGADLVRAFENHEIDNRSFHHAEHVEVAFGLLTKYDFIDASATYAKGIRALATMAGAPTKFNVTITYAFMSLIAERMAIGQPRSFEDFARENPDLMSKHVLSQWYRTERLMSDAARSVFLMPEPVSHSTVA